MKKTNPLADILLEVTDAETFAKYTVAGDGRSWDRNCAQRIVKAALKTLADDDRLPQEQRDLARQELYNLFPNHGVTIDHEAQTLDLSR